MMPNSIVLFAAGLGTRMAPLTDTIPKPLVYVAGKTLLDHAIDQCGDRHIIVNVHYRADQIRRHLNGRKIGVSDETDLLRETGGGLKYALPLLHSNPVITMNTDAVWRGSNPIETLDNAWLGKMEALLLMIPRDAAVGHIGPGDFDIDPDGRLRKGTDYVYSGVQIIKTDDLADIDEVSFSMWSLWNVMLARGTMYGVRYGGAWCDVGSPQSIPLAEAMLAEGQDV